jgi:uncharacterized protein (DUF2267 family)
MSVFDKTLQKSHLWLNDVVEELGTGDAHLAWSVLRAGLHALRDRLPISEAADFAAQLPLLIRGLFFEGWHPAHKPDRIRSAEEFLDGVRERLEPHDIDAARAFEAVMRVVARHVTQGELEQVKHLLPHAIRELMPVFH